MNNRVSRWIWVPALAALGGLASTAGCGSKESEGKVALDPTFENVHKEVLLTSCAFSSCHGERSPAANLDLTTVDSCAKLVWKDSCVRKDRSRVVPGSPEDSYLYSKVTGTDLGTPATAGDCAPKGDLPTHMPPTEKLPADKVELIRAWIDIGAPCRAGVEKDSSDAGVDAPVVVSPDAGSMQMPASLTSEAPTVQVGKLMLLTVKLEGAAPYGPSVAQPVLLEECVNADGAVCCTPDKCAAIGLSLCYGGDSCIPNGGQQVSVDVSNPDALAVPPSMTVLYSEGGNDTGQFAVQGLAPATGVVVKATVGTTTVELTLDVVP